MRLLIGAYGAGNRGDDAILLGCLKIFGTRDIMVYSLAPKEHRDYCPDIPFTTKFRDDLDELILGGGGILYDGSARNYMERVIAYLRQDKPVTVYGVGSHIMTSDVLIVKYALNRVNYLSVRTNWDKRNLEQIGIENIEVVRDPALEISPNIDKAKQLIEKYFDTSKPLIGLSCRNRSEFILPIFKSYQILSRDYTVVPIIMCKHRFYIPEMDHILFSYIISNLDISKEEKNKLLEWINLELDPATVKGIVHLIPNHITNRKHVILYSSVLKNHKIVGLFSDSYSVVKYYAEEYQYPAYHHLDLASNIKKYF